MATDSKARVIRMIEVFPVYELNHLGINLILCVQSNLNPSFLSYLSNIPFILYSFFPTFLMSLKVDFF